MQGIPPSGYPGVIYSGTDAATMPSLADQVAAVAARLEAAQMFATQGHGQGENPQSMPPLADVEFRPDPQYQGTCYRVRVRGLGNGQFGVVDATGIVCAWEEQSGRYVIHGLPETPLPGASTIPTGYSSSGNRRPGWLSPAEERQKRRTTPPTPPAAVRPRWEADGHLFQARTHAALQQQASQQQTWEAIRMALAAFGMVWEGLPEVEQEAVWTAALSVSDPGAREEALHAALSRIQPQQGMGLLSQLPGAPLAIGPEHLLPAECRSLTHYGGVTIDAPMLAQGVHPETVNTVLQENQVMAVAAEMSASKRQDKPAATLAYDSQMTRRHWRGARQKEFAPLLVNWNKATGKKESGPALLRHLSSLCDDEWAEGRGVPVDEGGVVWEFKVKPHTGMQTQCIWRGSDGRRVSDLRCAPAEGNADARTALLKDMAGSAKRSESASKRKDKLVAVLAYDSGTASNHWRGTRREEFEPLLAEWNTATGEQNSGPELLQRLSALCDAELVGKWGAPVDEAGVVWEFEVTLHEGMRARRIWRGVDGSGVPNLRRAPAAEATTDARTNLLKAMIVAAKKSESASKRQDKPRAALAYDSQLACSHWRWWKRREEFEPLLAEWNTATGRRNSGSALLQHLFALSEAEWAARRRVPEDDAGVVWEIEVTPHEGMPAQRIWRRVDGSGMPNLRRAPAAEATTDVRTTLLKDMAYVAKRNAISRTAKRKASGQQS